LHGSELDNAGVPVRKMTNRLVRAKHQFIDFNNI
jgi:hypothetical protein